MWKWLLLAPFVFLCNTSLGAWKEKKDHYEFRFDWENEGIEYWVTFTIPKQEVERSYNNIKPYNRKSRDGYEKVKDQFVDSADQPKKNATMIRFHYEKFIAQDSPYLKELAQGLANTAPDKSKRGLAEHTLAFVQSIPYSTDFENKAGYITPIRVLLDNKGDCDSKSALMAAILNQLGIDWSLLDFPDHILIAIDVPRYKDDSFLPKNGFVLAEPAGPGRRKLGSWIHRKGLEEVITSEPYSPTPKLKGKEPSEKAEITKLIEDAKLSISKRNTSVVGAKTTLKGLRNISKKDYNKINNKLASGEILDLGTYPNPHKHYSPTVIWKEEHQEIGIE